MEKNWKNRYICKTESLCYAPRQTQCYKWTILQFKKIIRKERKAKQHTVRQTGSSESQSCSAVSDSLWPTPILQARILEWVAVPFSGDPPKPGIKPRTPALWTDSLPAEPQGKPKNARVGSLSLLQRIFPN